MHRTTPILFVAIVCSMVSSPLFADDEKPVAEKQQIVVHLSHFTDDLHRTFMAFKVANLMQEYGADVTIFLDLEGVRLAERRQSLELTWGKHSMTLAEYYEKYTDNGGKVVLCPHCAKSAHLSDLGLKRNAEIGTMPKLGKMLIDADKVIDY
ncbi:MAG: DsrE family protein [bacterium]|nr:DsrE family protein [bacterium]